MADLATPPATSEPATAISWRRTWAIGIVAIAALGVVSHYLPLGYGPKTGCAAVALVAVCGGGVVIWLPRTKWDLCVSLVVSAGLAVNVIVSSALLAVNCYTPDVAALLAGALGCASGLIRVSRKATP